MYQPSFSNEKAFSIEIEVNNSLWCHFRPTWLLKSASNGLYSESTALIRCWIETWRESSLIHDQDFRPPQNQKSILRPELLVGLLLTGGMQEPYTSLSFVSFSWWPRLNQHKSYNVLCGWTGHPRGTTTNYLPNRHNTCRNCFLQK